MAPHLVLNEDGYYWFLYRYFEAANLDRRTGELIDLYGDSELRGYQLERLEEELLNARQDAMARPERWDVLVGWANQDKSRANELRRSVDRTEMVALIDSLLGLTRSAKDQSLALVNIGD